jgi:hypothetical protein
MVYNVPSVLVDHTIGYTPSIPADDQMFGCVVESTKGTPNEIVVIRSPEQLYQEFKVRMDAYFGVGGQAMYVVRAASDSANGGSAPTASNQTLKDTTATPVDALKLTAKQPGSYSIYITVSQGIAGGNSVTIEEEGYSPEYYPSVTGIQNLVDRINKEGSIVTAEFKAEGNGVLASITRAKLGATNGAVGTNGKTATSPEYAGQLDPTNAAVAHAKALKGLEFYKLAGVFTTCVNSDTAPAVFAQYHDHIDKMNSAMYHGWRFAILGAPEGFTKSQIMNAASGFNSENIVYVGQGVVDMNGTEYSPVEATQVVAGKMGASEFYEPIWGGDSTRILGIGDNGEKYISDVLALPGALEGTVATREEEIEYNETGVITFTKELDGIRIREAVTTVQNTELSQEDELAVMRIIRHVKYLIYERAYEMLGKNITSTYKTDLEEYIKSGLAEIKDVALIDIPESGLAAYTVSVQLIPRTSQRQGRVTVNVSVVPVHAAREIKAKVVVM